MIRPTLGYLRRFRRDEDGNGTIEFCLLLPIVITIFIMTIELGILFARQVMLDRGLDLAVRAVRVGAMVTVDHDNLVTAICEAAVIIPDCHRQLKLEMRPDNPRNFTGLTANADCIDREDDTPPVYQLTNGGQNQLMLLRACSLFDPLFPLALLGRTLPKQSGGAYALVSLASYVVEP